MDCQLRIIMWDGFFGTCWGLLWMGSRPPSFATTISCIHIPNKTQEELLKHHFFFIQLWFIDHSTLHMAFVGALQSRETTCHSGTFWERCLFETTGVAYLELGWSFRPVLFLEESSNSMGCLFATSCFWKKKTKPCTVLGFIQKTICVLWLFFHSWSLKFTQLGRTKQ